MKRLPDEYSKKSLQKIADRIGQPASYVEQVAAWRQSPIRSMDQLRAKGMLIIEIPQIAREYGTRYDLPENVLTECIFLVTEKFSHLAIEEIREAYRQYASGEIQAKGAEMYGGEFSASQLGKILTAYTEKRQTTLAAIIRAQSEEAEKQAAIERDAKLRAEFDATFRDRLIAASETAKSWQDIPAFWFWACYNRGWLKITVSEAEAILQRARIIAENEEPDAKRVFEKVISPINRAKSIAQSLTVYEWLKSENFKI